MNRLNMVNVGRKKSFLLFGTLCCFLLMLTSNRDFVPRDKNVEDMSNYKTDAALLSNWEPPSLHKGDNDVIKRDVVNARFSNRKLNEDIGQHSYEQSQQTQFGSGVIRIVPSIHTNSPFIHSPVATCPGDAQSDQPFLLVIVCSAISKQLNRDAIRDTWGNPKNIDRFKSKVVFLMGHPDGNETPMAAQNDIDAESAKYGDVIQGNFIDNYDNLATKSVHLLQWADENCRNVDYVMKVDDDVYLNMYNLDSVLQNIKVSHFIMGNVIRKAEPIRDKQSKYYIPRRMYAGKYYPEYTSGTSYVMSRGVVHKLFLASKVLPFFPMEDIYITGQCAQKANVTLVNHARFIFWRQKFHPCNYDDQISAHFFNARNLRVLWNSLNKTDWKCDSSVQ